MSFLVLAALLSLLAPGRLAAQPSPTGSEFQVNAYSTDDQTRPAVAVTSNGDFIVVWESFGQDGSDFGVFAQRFSAEGERLGAEFQISTYATSRQYRANVAAVDNGDFIVAWDSADQDGADRGIFAARFGSDGSPLGGEFLVNAYTTDKQQISDVVAAAGGDFVVVWESSGQDGSSTGIFGQRFGPNGSFVGPLFQVNSFTTNAQHRVAADAAPNGDFVVTWMSIGQDGSDRSIHGQRFSSDGSMRGGEFQINTYSTDVQAFPDVSVAPNGDFMVVWDSKTQDGDKTGIFGQGFASDGSLRGAEFQVNNFTTDNQTYAAIASSPDGHFNVVWRSDDQDGSGQGIHGREVGPGGELLGPEFQINTYTTGDQYRVAVSNVANGRFVVTWASDGPDGSAYSVQARRYLANTSIFSDGFETGDTSVWSDR